MLGPIFEQAGRSASRQRVFRQFLLAHLAVTAGVLFWIGGRHQPDPVGKVGAALFIAAIVEGSLLIGWRLTQLPKTNAMEPLLLTPVWAPLILIGEHAVGLAWFGLITASALPLLIGAVALGWMTSMDVLAITLMPLTWGLVVGYGLVWWAYEPTGVRQAGERLSLIGLAIYLIVGVLFAEKTQAMLTFLPWGVGEALRTVLLTFHHDNPLALLAQWDQPTTTWSKLLIVQTIGMTAIMAFVLRSSCRLKGHYTDRHYRPLADRRGEYRDQIGDAPLRWWALKRVREYAGRVNLYLAAGISAMYALYLLAGDHWPTWMGRGVLSVIDTSGGVAGLTTALVLLSAVPAAYQYGLWDSTAADRLKKLELLLLTRLSPTDYLWASWAASWSRGRGYWASALLLWLAGWASGRLTGVQAGLGITMGAVLLLVYFAIGFHFFARADHAASIGFGLTVGVPLAAWGLAQHGLSDVSALLPPGMVYAAVAGQSTLQSIVVGGLALTLGVGLIVLALRRFDDDLRSWCDRHQQARA